MINPVGSELELTTPTPRLCLPQLSQLQVSPVTLKGDPSRASQACVGQSPWTKPPMDGVVQNGCMWLDLHCLGCNRFNLGVVTLRPVVISPAAKSIKGRWGTHHSTIIHISTNSVLISKTLRFFDLPFPIQ